MNKKWSIPRSLRDVDTHYCPGCGHGVLHRLVAEVVDELGIQERVVGVAPVGCAVIAYDYWDFDCAESAHGRALAVATGMKRVRPETVVFTYQGDGDLASIGTAETLHAANRGENLTCIFVNNACYGMTGGQMAPTTVLGQVTATTPQGRNPRSGDGWPLKISELLASFPGTAFIARTTITGPKEIMKTRNYIKKGFLNQMNNQGFSLIEVLSPCPTIWQKEPYSAMQWIEKEMTTHFPLGVMKE